MTIFKVTTSIVQQILCIVALAGPLILIDWISSPDWKEQLPPSLPETVITKTRKPSSIGANKTGMGGDSLKNLTQKLNNGLSLNSKATKADLIFNVDCKKLLKNRKKKPNIIKVDQTMARFFLTNCPISTKIVNLSTRGRGGLFQKEKGTFVSDFISLTKGRNKIEFHIDRRKYTFYVKRPMDEFKN